ncbi:MAG: pyridoxamine 5'-phosphate oxidase [Longimonas sp.]|uniref:pyridoxamine 5'-phosphate oxidase n=1 Tax=Longimonas sp. TaxID=2039626 RepID=UPI003976B4B2
MPTDIANLREEYTRATLTRDEVASNPIAQFRAWLDAAIEADLPEPNAMTLATADKQGRPASRVVLLKELDTGFVLYTNYQSQKGQALQENPHAALTFWWEPMERQVRVQGHAERVSEEQSDAYFAKRPRSSQLGAWTSPQSRVIDGRDVLDDNWAQVKERFGEEGEVPRPPHWGGIRIVPHTVEFWQGRPSRLHDRLRYRRPDADSEDPWTIERLAP